MNVSEIIKNQALESSPCGFELPEAVCLPDEAGNPCYKYMPKALVYKENGDTEFNLYYWKHPDIQSAEIRLMCDYKGQRTATFPMNEIQKNWWQVTIPDIEPGTHIFHLLVNGLPCIHPAAPLYFNGEQYSNYVDVPNPADDTYLLKDVPHGTIRTEYYFSSVVNRMRTCMVYTPPGYDSSNEDYPVLYLQHGGGENEMGWFSVGKANFIMDNLIAEGKCRKMLVVCNNGYVFNPADNPLEKSHLENLSHLLIRDCAPFIEKNFRVQKGKEHRALAGLSMGSMETQIMAYKYPEFADYIGMMSGASLSSHFSVKTTMIPDPFDPEPYYQDIDAFNASHKLLFISQGYAEGGTTLAERMQPYFDRGIQAELFTCEGSHEFRTWRQALYVFAQKLFI